MLTEPDMSEEEREHRQRMLEFAQKFDAKSLQFWIYSCPICRDDVPVADHDKLVSCQSCNTKLRVDRDATFEEGVWHDLTRLIPIE